MFFYAADVSLSAHNLRQNDRRKLLVCHDMQGGYKSDAELQSTEPAGGYSLRYGADVHVFVYFSHHTITIPPPSWITCCHANGTAVLGTVIFEWEDGAAKCRKFLQRNPDGSLAQAALAFCDNLVSLCCQMHFDGFLINVECALTPAEVTILLEWLSVVREKLKLRIPHSLLIWYDAVTIDGQLVWQNALNAKNQPFFDVCDAIFLNYAWDQTAASSSAFAAGNRTCDVFLGVDVFGRGTFGGGKFNSHAASAIAQALGCSLAVFAPGWTHECTPDGMDIDDCESMLWLGHEWKPFDESKWSSVHGGSGWKVDKSGPCGSETFTASFALCKREMHASISLPSDASGITYVRSTACVKGTPPNCADSYTLSLKLSIAEALPLEVVAARCPAGHDTLPFLFSGDRHVCDCCSSPIRSGSKGWRCIECDHDVCRSCHNAEFDEIDPEECIMSSQCANGVSGVSWKSISLYVCASASGIDRLASQRNEKTGALFAHFSLSGKDAEGWAGHHGTAFACSSVSHLNQSVSQLNSGPLWPAVLFRTQADRNSFQVQLLHSSSGEGHFTMIHGICESQTPWYNPSSSSSLFPSKLPPLPQKARCTLVQQAYVREDRNYCFDGGSSACIIMAADSFSRAVGFTCVPCEDNRESESFSATIAVAGNLHFCILAEFVTGDVAIGCESHQSIEMISNSLQIHKFRSLNARVLNYNGNREWRLLSWNVHSIAALKTFTVCACSRGGPDVGIGWIGAVAVGKHIPAAPVASSADFNCIHASATASRKMLSFACAPEDETCNIQCLWNLPSSVFFPSVDIYLVSKDCPLETSEHSDLLIWQGRSASGFFIITDVPLSLPLHVVFMGTDLMLQRITLARVLVSVPFALSSNTFE